jgi:hypothetical protein
MGRALDALCDGEGRKVSVADPSSDDRLSRGVCKPLDRIRAAVQDSTEALLDRRPFADQEHGEVLQRLTCFDPPKIQYADVPLGAIMTLGREDFWMRGDSWRVVVSRNQEQYDPHGLGMHGRDWSDLVFSYFEGDLLERSFPATGAEGPLKLQSFGGYVTYESGNHRLVGGYCWLAAKHGLLAILRKARVATYALRYAIRQRIAEALMDGRDFAVMSGGPAGVLAFASSPLQSARWWNKPKLLVSFYDPIKDWCTPRTENEPRASLIGGVRHQVPSEVAHALLSDAWLMSQRS